MVEGAFGRVFRSGLRPVELGRRLVREMDARRSIGVSGRSVAPNHFVVRLSASDLESLGDIHDSLVRELCETAREHARDESYGFMGPVTVELVEDDRLHTGGFAIDARMVEAAGGVAVGTIALPDGGRVALGEFVAAIGRLPECAVALSDANVSRRHAEIRPHGSGFRLVDLGSTNGTTVNGMRITERDLSDGDVIVVGATRLVFEVS
jgi:hypothetical protein